MVYTAARAALAAAFALALPGCLGDDSSGAPAPGQGAGVGQPIQLANCRDWNKADPRQRSHTVKDLKAFAGGPTGGSAGRTGATLSDDRAYEVLEDTCDAEYARGFKLYKLYTRAAAFGNLRP